MTTSPPNYSFHANVGKAEACINPIKGIEENNANSRNHCTWNRVIARRNTRHQHPLHCPSSAAILESTCFGQLLSEIMPNGLPGIAGSPHTCANYHHHRRIRTHGGRSHQAAAVLAVNVPLEYRPELWGQIQARFERFSDRQPKTTNARHTFRKDPFLWRIWSVRHLPSLQKQAEA